MKWFSLSLLTLLVFVASLSARAQTPDIFNNPTLEKSKNAALGNVAARLGKAGVAKGNAAATRFTPVTPPGKHLTLDSFMDRLTTTTEEKNGLRPVLVAVFDAYEKAAMQAGHSNDIAAALTFYLVAHYSAYHEGSEGKAVGDAAQEVVISQFQAALNTDALRATTNENKQRLYEFFVLMGGFTGAMRQLGIDQKDAGVKQLAHELGGNGLKFALSVGPDRVRITETGLSITPEQAIAATPTKPTVAPAGSGGLSDLSVVGFLLCLSYNAVYGSSCFNLPPLPER